MLINLQENINWLKNQNLLYIFEETILSYYIYFHSMKNWMDLLFLKIKVNKIHVE